MILLVAGPASACRNDSQVKAVEQEFRPPYLAEEPAREAEPASVDPGTAALAGLGVLLVLAAGYEIGRQSGRRSG